MSAILGVNNNKKRTVMKWTNIEKIPDRIFNSFFKELGINWMFASYSQNHYVGQGQSDEHEELEPELPIEHLCLY